MAVVVQRRDELRPHPRRVQLVASLPDRKIQEILKRLLPHLDVDSPSRLAADEIVDSGDHPAGKNGLRPMHVRQNQRHSIEGAGHRKCPELRVEARKQFYWPGVLLLLWLFPQLVPHLLIAVAAFSSVAPLPTSRQLLFAVSPGLAPSIPKLLSVAAGASALADYR
jgi:hypothetical protein